MSGNKKHLIYWDSCIFLAWMTNENRSQLELDGIEELAKQLHKEEIHLATSVLTLTEVLECHLTHEVRSKFEKLFHRKNFNLVDVNRKVAGIAHDIRSYYLSSTTDFRSIKTPDSIHLATAIHMECDCFYTFDDKLLNLNGKLANNYSLNIEKPSAIQPILFRANEEWTDDETQYES